MIIAHNLVPSTMVGKHFLCLEWTLTGCCGGRFSGHRIGTAEVESALVSHPQCAEAAVVGFDHEVGDSPGVIVIADTSLFSFFFSLMVYHIVYVHSPRNFCSSIKGSLPCHVVP